MATEEAVRVQVAGHPDMGKTTLVQALAPLVSGRISLADHERRVEPADAFGTCDAVLVPISVRLGEFEAAYMPSGCTRDYLLRAWIQGVPHAVVCLSKVSAESLASGREAEIETEVRAFARRRLSEDFVSVVRANSQTGEDVVTVAAALEALPSRIQALRSRPLLVQMREVHVIAPIGDVIVGRVHAGELRPGTVLHVAPPGSDQCRVESMEMAGHSVAVAGPGDDVGFNVSGLADRRPCSFLTERWPMRAATSFEALVTLCSGGRAQELLEEGRAVLVSADGGSSMGCVLVDVRPVRCGRGVWAVRVRPAEGAKRHAVPEGVWISISRAPTPDDADRQAIAAGRVRAVEAAGVGVKSAAKRPPRPAGGS